MSEVVKLDHAITVDGKTVNELTLRRPKVRDIKAVNGIKDDFNKFLQMTANLAQISPSELEEMDAADMAKVSQVVGKFLAPEGS